MKNITDRQSPKVILAVLLAANMGAGNGFEAKLPQGALVLNVQAVTATAFNSGTTATLTVGDGTTTFVNAQDVATPGTETSAVSQKYYPAGGTITGTLAQTGSAATAGRVLVAITYVEAGAGGTIYG